jgi:hypothetical protein
MVTGGRYSGIEIGWDIVQPVGDGRTYKYTFEDSDNSLLMAPSIGMDAYAPDTTYEHLDSDPSLRLVAGPNGLGQRDVLPEPGTMALMGIGLVALGIAMRRRINAKESSAS